MNTYVYCIYIYICIYIVELSMNSMWEIIKKLKSIKVADVQICNTPNV